MKDVKLIADLVRAGIDADLVGRIVNEIIASNVRDNVRDTVKEYERQRKEKQRNPGRKQTMSAAAEVSKIPTDVRDNVRDSDAALLLTSLPSSNSLLEKQKAKEEVVARRDRGTRIPDGWQLSPALTALAIEYGQNPKEFETEFKDYWVAVPGQRGRKLDWEATARNRIKEIGKRQRVKGDGKRTIMEACDDLLDRVRAFDESAPSDLRDGASQGIVGLIPKG